MRLQRQLQQKEGPKKVGGWKMLVAGGWWWKNQEGGQVVEKHGTGFKCKLISRFALG